MQQELAKTKAFSEQNEKLLAEKTLLEEALKKVTKENQRYEQMLTTASTGYTTQDFAANSKSLKNHSSLGHAKISNESLEAGDKEKNKNKDDENERLRLWIVELQNTLIFMRDKEAKLIKLLIAVKNKGVDLDQIFKEEVLNDKNPIQGDEPDEVEEFVETKENMAQKSKSHQPKEKRKPEKSSGPINNKTAQKQTARQERNSESLMFADESGIIYLKI